MLLAGGILSGSILSTIKSRLVSYMSEPCRNIRKPPPALIETNGNRIWPSVKQQREFCGLSNADFFRSRR